MDNQTEIKAAPKKRNKVLMISLIIAAAAVILTAGILAITGVFTPADKTIALVAIEINPGVIFETDKTESVAQVVYTSDDAKEMLKGIDLSGTNALSAIGTIAALAEREGYLGESMDNKITLLRFSDKNDKEKFFTDAAAKLEETLGFKVEITVKSGSFEEGKAYIKFKEDQKEQASKPQNTPTKTPKPLPSLQPTLSAAPTPSPTPAPPSGDSAGTGDVMFDIYDTMAVADITNDGTADEISFSAASASSTLTVNGTSYTIDIPNLAQKFAITDVDVSDSWLEIAFCDAYHTPDFELDWPSTFYCWYNGTDFIECGSFWNMGWDGAWRADFDANEHMDGHGIIMSVDRSQNFTDAWYMAHWTLDGTNRQKKEDLYAANLLYPTEDLTLKKPCLLLGHISLDYFDPSYASIWDHASWPHADGRAIDPGGTGDVVIIAQPGETLEVVKVYGKRWFKLRTSDGYSGWIRVVDFKMSGYDDVMYIDAWDIFDNIVVAG